MPEATPATQNEPPADEAAAPSAALARPPLPAELPKAIDDIGAATAAFAYDGSPEAPASPPAAPAADASPERPFVPGDDDPRDAGLRETPLSEDRVWGGLIFDVNRLHVRLPDGREAARDVIRHPGAVAVVALTDEGRICLVRQYRTALGRVTVEIPAGKLDPGEDPLDCARRELAEETGMRAERLAFLTTIATSCGFADELIHIYMATGLTRGEAHPDDDEFLGVDLVPLGELVDAVLDGRVEDAKTVVGALICDAVSHRLAAGDTDE